MGNKSDLGDKRQVSTVDARKFCAQNGGMQLFETSAKENINVEKAFKDLGKLAIQR